MTQPAHALPSTTSIAKKIIIGLISITILAIIGVGTTYYTVKNSFEPALESIAESSNGALKLKDVTTGFGLFDSYAISLWELENGLPIMVNHQFYNLPFVALVKTEVLGRAFPLAFTSYLTLFGSETSFDLERYELPLEDNSLEILALENIIGSLSLNNSQDLKLVMKAKTAAVQYDTTDRVKMNDLFILVEGSLNSIELFDVVIEIENIEAVDNSFKASEVSFFASSGLEDGLINIDYFGSLKNGFLSTEMGDEISLDKLSFKSSLIMPQQVYQTLTRDAHNINEDNAMQSVALALEKGISLNVQSLSAQYRLKQDDEPENFDMSGSLQLSATAEEVNILAENPMMAMNLVKGQFYFDMALPFFIGVMQALPMASESIAMSSESAKNRGNKVMSVELKNSEIFVNNEKVM